MDGEELGVVPAVFAGRRLTLRLVKVVMRGFKVFSQHTVVGPLDGFTCVMGANGSGKSVLGDAIAFGLGASARMLRVECLSQVISTCPDENGALPEEAEVALHFYMVDAASGEVCGALGVRRCVVHRSGRAATAAAQCWLDAPEPLPRHPTWILQDLRDDGEDAVTVRILLNRAVGDGGDHDGLGWQPCGRAALVALVAPFGLELGALERVVVSQHRRADAAADPGRLAAAIEAAVGGGAAAAAVEAAREELAQAEKVDALLDDEYEALQDAAEAVRPAVARWRRLADARADHLRRSVEAVGAKAAALEREGATAAAERAAAETAARGATGGAESARRWADQLLEALEAADQVYDDARARVNRLESRYAEAQQEARRAEVRLTEAGKAAALAAAAAGSAKGRKTAEKQAGKRARKAAALAEEACALRVAATAAQEAAAAAAAALAEDPGGCAVLAARDEWKAAQGRAAAAAAAVGDAVLVSKLAAEGAAAAAAALAIHQAALGAAQKSRAATVAAAAAATAHTAKLGEEADAAEEAAAQAAASLKELHAREEDITAEIVRVEAALDVEGSAAGALDAAVRRLAEGAAGPGFHGRLHSLLRAAAPGALRAANAVFMERCSPAATVAVATHATAEAAVDHCKDSQAGWINCRVLDEMEVGSDVPQTVSTKQAEEAVAQAAAVPVTAVPLAALVAAAPGVPGAEALRGELFGGWLLVDSAASASAALDAERVAAAAAGRRPRPLRFVTLGGALLKADGEAVGEKSRGVIDGVQPYLLRTAFVDAAGGGGASVGGAGGAGLHRLAARLEELQAALMDAKELQDEALEASMAADGIAGGKAQGARAAAARAEAAARAAAKAERAVDGASAVVEKARAAAEEAREKAAAAAGDLREAKAAAAAAAAEEKAAQSRYAAAAAYEPAAVGCLDAESEAAVLQGDLEEAEAAAASAAEAAAAAEARLARAGALIAAAKAAAQKKEEAAARAAEADLEVEAAQAALRSAEHAADEAGMAVDEANARWRAALEVHEHLATELQQHLAAAAAAAARGEAAARDGAAAQNFLDDLHVQMAEASELYVQLPVNFCVHEAVQGGAAPSGDGGGAAIADAPAADGSGSSSDSETLEARRVHQRVVPSPTPAPERRRLRHARRRSGAAAAPPPWEDADIERALKELQAQEDELAAMEAGIDYDAVATAVDIAHRSQELGRRLAAAEAATSAAAAALETAKAVRYAAFAGAMDAVDGRLRRVYRELTGGAGDAAALFGGDPETAFSEGVRLRVCPEGGSWSEFRALSGGQKALAAAALSLSLTAVAPSPLFFFDEIDAALDSINSEQLAAFLERYCGEAAVAVATAAAVGLPPQVIAVTHRLPMQQAAERAGSLVQVMPHATDSTVLHHVLTLCPRHTVEAAEGADADAK